MYYLLRILSIDNTPKIASSSRTVSVAWFGKKLKVLEFWTLLIFSFKISWIPLSGDPNTTSTGLLSFLYFSAIEQVKFFPFFDVKIISLFQYDKSVNKLVLSLT